MEMSKMKRNYKKRVAWTLQHEEMVMQLWSDNSDRLRGPRRSMAVFRDIHAKFGRSPYSPNDIRVKIQNLTARYKKEKQLQESSGTPTDWPLYDRIDKIMLDGPPFGNEHDTLCDGDSMFETIEIKNQLDFSMLGDKPQGSNSSFIEPNTPPREPIAAPTSEPEHRRQPEPSPSHRPPGCDDQFSHPNEFYDALDDIRRDVRLFTDNFRLTNERMLDIEVSRNRLLERFVRDASELKTALVKFLDKKK